ncbi:hypothetical protein IWX49DRAFT_120624 [Phyllosticta citricarpa]|uniref:Uncharacterized protein n=1 Tax=Phyllosticta citricarpa TaxID=55181 RepID=A0ABR1MD01_9PEZI
MYVPGRLRSTRPLACLVACAVSCHPTERNLLNLPYLPYGPTTHALIHLAFVFRSSPHLRLLLPFSSSVCCFGYHSPHVPTLRISTPLLLHSATTALPCSSAFFFPVLLLPFSLYILHVLPSPPPSPLTPSGCHVPCGRVTYSCDPLLDT